MTWKNSMTFFLGAHKLWKDLVGHHRLGQFVTGATWRMRSDGTGHRDGNGWKTSGFGEPMLRECLFWGRTFKCFFEIVFRLVISPNTGYFHVPKMCQHDFGYGECWNNPKTINSGFFSHILGWFYQTPDRKWELIMLISTKRKPWRSIYKNVDSSSRSFSGTSKNLRISPERHRCYQQTRSWTCPCLNIILGPRPS